MAQEEAMITGLSITIYHGWPGWFLRMSWRENSRNPLHYSVVEARFETMSEAVYFMSYWRHMWRLEERAG